MIRLEKMDVAGWFVLACVVTVLAACCGACAGSQGAKSPARETARAAMLSIAEGVKLADQSCAVAAKIQKNAEAADKCAEIYTTARASLKSAESLIDTWDAASQSGVLCSLSSAAASLEDLADVVDLLGGKIQAAVIDATKFADVIEKGACR